MEDHHLLLQKQRSFFKTGETKGLTYRLEALQKLKQAIITYEDKLMAALKMDLNKSEFDAYTTEIGVVLSELSFTIKHLKAWMSPQKVKTPMTHAGSKSYLYSEPYGVTLIIAPWNYPFQLAVAPLIGAIAAGNCVVIKPSELTPQTSEVLAELIKNTFPEHYVSTILGGVETSQSLLQEKFNYIFFTGSVAVGKVVMEAASKHLTPVTLELGGKSPCIVDKTAHLKIAAKRIVWGKFMNAGQTCIAPDYLYLHSSVKNEFLSYMKQAIEELYGKKPLQNNDFTHIVNDKHFSRLCSYLDDGNIYLGGKADSEQLIIEPTILTEISWKDAVMKDEIFGPILPVLEFDDISDVINGIENHPNPLSLYLFTENEEVENKILESVSFGGGCINDTVYHFTSPYLPFGGVGNSGTGAYHGKGSFDTFSHKKSVLKQTTLFDIPLRYPNVKNGLKKIKKFLK